MKKVFFFVFICLQLTLFTQIRDSVIFIPLGKSQINTSDIKGEIKSVQCGMFHVNFLMSDGSIISRKDPKALGLDIPMIKTKVNDIATGDIHSVLLFSDKSIAQYFTTPAFSMFYPSKLENVRQVASGSNMSIALNSKNIMYTWGPTNLVKKLAIPIKTYGVKAASVGKNHVAFINIKDRVFVWGDHSKGQNNIPKFSSKPIEIASGDNHAIVRDETGNVYTWGNNERGQCEQPVSTQKAKQVLAKGNLSAIVYEHNQIAVWGYNKQLAYNFNKTGEIKTVGLGTDFLIVVLQITDSNHPPIQLTTIDLKKSWMADTLAQDSIHFDLQDTLNPSNFFENVAHQNFKQNSIKVISKHSTSKDKKGSTELVFEGEGNEVTIINENMSFNTSGKQQRVIFKGSNNKVVIRQTNGTINDNNFQETVVIDLDSYSPTETKKSSQDGEKEYFPQRKSNYYSAEYIESESENNESYENVFIEIDSLPSTGISDWPIYNDYYYIEADAFAKALDKNYMIENISFLPNSFRRAQLYFYLGQTENGIITLKNSIIEGNDDQECALALFEIYYYGLFDKKTSITKANKYYAEYSAILKMWE